MNPKKILFVVHRYAPYPGGSEIYVQNMAEEMKKRGHIVTVFAKTHKGTHNGIVVTDDHMILFRDWDLIIVHGGDCDAQDITHQHAALIRSPVLYMIIKPSVSPGCRNGMKFHDYLGYSSSIDRQFLQNYWAAYNQFDIRKLRRVRHGVKLEDTVVEKNPNSFFGNGNYQDFISAGGFWPHKGFEELSDAFWNADIKFSRLTLFGYTDNVPDGRFAPEKEIVIASKLPKTHIMWAMQDATAYVLNSTEEGFGLVLIEAMLNKCPWIARNVGGVSDLAQFGTVYNSKEELTNTLKTYTIDVEKVERAYQYALANHTIQATCNDLEDILMEKCTYAELLGGE